jgi:hypothetical protein
MVRSYVDHRAASKGVARKRNEGKQREGHTDEKKQVKKAVQSMAYFLVLLWSIPWSLDLYEFADPVLSIPDNEIGNPTTPLCVAFAKE